MASGRPYRTKHELVMAFMANVAKTSQTSVTGRQRGSRGPRPGKPNAGMSGSDLAARVTRNMCTVAQMIARITDPCRDQTEWSVKQFVGTTIRWIHYDVPNARKLKKLRSHETHNAYGCPSEEVPAQWEKFLAELQSRIDTDDPRRLAAWAEYEVRFSIHPLADGSGRLATAMAAWIMLRKGQHIPNYAFVQRSEMHTKLREGLEEFETYYLAACFPRVEVEGAEDPFDHAVPVAAAS